MKIYQFKTQDSEIQPYLLCLQNISKHFKVDNIKKHGLNELVYDFSLDYDTVATSDIVDIDGKSIYSINAWIH